MILSFIQDASINLPVDIAWATCCLAPDRYGKRKKVVAESGER